MWALVIARRVKKCKNVGIKELVAKYAALVGVFTHSAVNYDALCSIQKSLSSLKKE